MTDESSSPEFRSWEGQLEAVRSSLATAAAGIINTRDLKINPRQLAIFSASHEIDPHPVGEFVFSGRLSPSGMPEIEEVGSIPTAVIDYISIPEAERERGVGRRFVNYWEEACRSVGIRVFVAENVIETDQAQNFWRRMGYIPPRSELGHTSPPILMYKIIPSGGQK